MFIKVMTERYKNMYVLLCYILYFQYRVLLGIMRYSIIPGPNPMKFRTGGQIFLGE